GSDVSWRLLDRYTDTAPLLGIAVFYRATPWAMALCLAAALGTVMDAYARASAAAYGLVLRAALAPTLVYFLLAASLVFGGKVDSSGGALRTQVAYPLTLVFAAAVVLVLHGGAILLTRAVRRNLRLLAQSTRA